MTSSATDLRVLVLPVSGADLLLPAGAVAEIVRGDALGPPPQDAPDWVIGTLAWRGHALPVARLAPAPAAGAPPATLVVCLAPGAHGTLPYLALESPRLPHLEPVGPSDLTPETETPEGAPWFVRSPLRIKGNAAWMLDLEAVEGRLLR